jgi:GntR family transcriptional regulator/MocR family aminotransferase
MEFVIPLSEDGEPLYRQIYLHLRKAILAGDLAAGQRLAATRDLAQQLGVSRTVVVLAYDQLLAEGFVGGRRGSGTFVSASFKRQETRRVRKPADVRLSHFGVAATAAAGTLDFPNKPPSRLRYDFAVGRSDLTTFPYEAWKRILLRHAQSIQVRQLDYGPAAGAVPLREAICDHVRRSRLVDCDPSEVVVVNGAQQALDLIARVLVDRGDPVAIENPQYQGIREVLRAAGARLLAVPVDRDGLDPAKLPERARLVFVTPSHQFPTGAVLPLARRLALIEWARRNNAIIVENDYDGEFHYRGRPLESLQGLDAEGRILYIGTFSRTVFPALRIGYLIVPRSIAAAFTTAKWLSDQHSATLEQNVLAEFIRSGLYGRYLRRQRRANTLRREALLESIEKHIGDRAEMTGEDAGTHIVLWPQNRDPEDVLIARAASHGVGVYGISNCYLGRPPRAGLMLGYSTLNAGQIREGIRLLAEVL